MTDQKTAITNLDKKVDSAFGLIRKNEKSIQALEKNDVAIQKDNEHIMTLIKKVEGAIRELSGTIEASVADIKLNFVSKEILEALQAEGKWQKRFYAVLGSVITFVIIGIFTAVLGFTS